MNWSNPENLSYLLQYLALAFFLASLLVFVFKVALPVHRLVIKLAAYADKREGAPHGVFKNDAEVLAHVFKLLTEDVERKERELQSLYEQARHRARFMERFSDRLLESVPAALLGFDAGGSLVTLNSAAEGMLRIRLSEARGHSVSELVPTEPEVRALLSEAISEGRPLQGFETAWRLPSGETRYVEVSGAPLLQGEGKEGGYVFSLFDRTPMRQLETQARMNERLSSWADLSTGLAHQLRNPLGGVLGYTDLILKKAPAGSEIEELARSVQDDARLLKKAVDDFIEFLREREASEKPLFWPEVVADVRRDLDREMAAKGVRWEGPLGEGGAAMRLDRGSAYQAVFNLVLNAVEAAPQGGQVSVRYVEDPPGALTGICVEDSGPGVPEALREKVFLPFFTTKPEGRGLGLSVAYRVAQSARGRLALDRSPLGGARFTLWVPALGDAPHGRKEDTPR